jgi:FtsP/CotA-like multicopper oxidase with cupredoxin domain
MSSGTQKNNKKGEEKQGLERREFIKMGAGGLAASLTACAAPTLTSQISDGPGDTPTSDPTQNPAKPAIPEIGNTIDPELFRSDNWQEPWTWRPEQWPEAELDLNVVRNQNPGVSTSPGNDIASIFSFNGTSPGPTIRVKQDGTLRIRVRNTMGQNLGLYMLGPAPDMLEFPEDFRMKICSLVEKQVLGGDPENPERCPPPFYKDQVNQLINVETRPGWNIGGHINGEHCTHTTNIHTHGLHVHPQTNPDGTHSDNIFLRIIPSDDFKARKAEKGEDAEVLLTDEHVAELGYKLQLGFNRDGMEMPHPPGTHWYHPHSHGSTHHQVSSGMAGFLLVEGDVDQAINAAMTGEDWPDNEIPSGLYGYRERQMFLQRVFVFSNDPDASTKQRNLRRPPFFAINGAREPTVFTMQPGAVERWRVLNGSVDGAGTKRFMVLDGQFVQKNNRIWRVKVETTGEGEDQIRTRTLEPTTEQDIEDAKVDLQQLSLDGITLVTEENGKAVHRIKDLSKQNAGTKNPFASPAKPGQSEAEAQHEAFTSVFKDGDSLRRAFVRPNEIYLTNANRADVFFKAPMDSAGKIFTIFAKEAHIHTDNLQQTHQRHATNPDFPPFRRLFDVVMGYVRVQGKPVEGGDFDIQSLNAHLPPVPPLLLPVTEDELVISAREASKTGAKAGQKRCRVMSYSGTGGADFPIIKVPPGYAEKHAEYENVLWTTVDGVNTLMPNLTRTMGINPEFDLATNPNPGLPRKFAPHDDLHPKMLLDTAEEWVVYNSSQMLWAHTDLERFPQPGAHRFHFESYPMSRAEGQRRFKEDPEFKITVKGADHPFHIHINPMWVLRIDVPDENGELHNVLPEPQWMDTVPIPRNGGRVIFRSRFEDFVGKWINHCHILLHEDNGMMQIVECTDDASRVNYKTREQVASPKMSGREVDKIYPKPSMELMYRQNLSFIDPTELGYQEYP